MLERAGGHNVIAGLFDLLAARRPGSRLLGFLNGPRGIVQGDAHEITAAALVLLTPGCFYSAPLQQSV